MHRWLTRGLFGIGLLLAVSRPAEEPAAAQVRKPTWHTDYAAARAAARQSGQPLFVVFRCQP
jgi:hypothetical protein